MKRIFLILACVISANIIPNTVDAIPVVREASTILSPESLSPSWVAASGDFARTQVGKPYVYGAAGPNAYDCSGLVYYSYSRPPVKIGRLTRDQIAQTRPIPYTQIQKGDLIFYGVDHVAIYYDSNMMVEALNQSTGVRLTPVRNYGEVRTYR